MKKDIPCGLGIFKNNEDGKFVLYLWIESALIGNRTPLFQGDSIEEIQRKIAEKFPF